MKLVWYGFLGVFGVVGASLALLNGAGVMFGLLLIGFAVGLHLAWLIAGDVRRTRVAQERAAEAQQRTFEVTQKMAANLEWALFAPESEDRAPVRQDVPA